MLEGPAIGSSRIEAPSRLVIPAVACARHPRSRLLAMAIIIVMVTMVTMMTMVSLLTLTTRTAPGWDHSRGSLGFRG